MKPYYLLLLVGLAGCSHTTYLSDTSDHGGMVNLVTQLNHDNAVQKANDYCRQYNLVARVTNEDPASNTMLFACQPAP